MKYFLQIRLFMNENLKWTLFYVCFSISQTFFQTFPIRESRLIIEWSSYCSKYITDFYKRCQAITKSLWFYWWINWMKFSLVEIYRIDNEIFFFCKLYQMAKMIRIKAWLHFCIGEILTNFVYSSNNQIEI